MAPKKDQTIKIVTESEKPIVTINMWLQVILPAVIFVSSASVLFFKVDRMEEAQRANTKIMLNLAERIVRVETTLKIRDEVSIKGDN